MSGITSATIVAGLLCQKLTWKLRVWHLSDEYHKWLGYTRQILLSWQPYIVLWASTYCQNLRLRYLE